MSVNSINKSIQFDHDKGTIKGLGELVSFERVGNQWEKINDKFYRFQNLKVVPDQWGNYSYSVGDCVMYENRYFVCVRANTGFLNDVGEKVINDDDTVNTAFWREYTDQISNISGTAILAEYKDYYNFCLCSEDLSKNKSMTDIINKTSGSRRLYGKELNDYLKSLRNTPWILNNITVQENDTFLLSDKSFVLKASIQNVSVEHMIEQEILSSNPNDIFCVSAYVKQKEHFLIGLGLSIQSDTGIVNYIGFYNLYDGTPISVKWYDSNYNELLEDPNVLYRVSQKIIKINDDSVYRIALEGQIKSTSYQPAVKIKIFIPNDNLDIKYITERELSVYINDIQYTIQQNFLQNGELPYQYLPTSLKTTKSEILTNKYYRSINGNITPFDNMFVISDDLPKVSDYEIGDKCFVVSPIDFPDGLKLGERTDDSDLTENGTLTYYKPDSEEYRQIIRNKRFRFLTSVKDKWKAKLYNAFVFNKYGYYRNAGEQFRHHG